MARQDQNLPDGENRRVRKRLVLNFPGFEPTGSERQIGRMHYSAEKTGKHWGFKTENPQVRSSKTENHSVATFHTSGKDWETETRVVQFRWNDIVHKYEQEGFPFGFLKNFGKFLGFFFDGTVRKYRKASLRYWGFTIYPVLLALLVFFASWILLAFFIDNVALEIVLSLLVTLLFCYWPGEKLYVLTTIADWGFARDMVNQANPEIEDRFSEFARTLRREISRTDADEILIVGHSFGSLWAVRAASLALEKDASLFKGRDITFLALGSSLLKIALARNAGFMRESLRKVLNQNELFWHEIQTKDDWIAFYKADPFKALSLKDMKADRKITKIRFSKAMDKQHYRKMRKSFYTTHRQYILYYDKRCHFDYMMRLFGPFSSRQIARNEKWPNRIDQNGALV